jgi:hypothetical protein
VTRKIGGRRALLEALLLAPLCTLPAAPAFALLLSLLVADWQSPLSDPLQGAGQVVFLIAVFALITSYPMVFLIGLPVHFIARRFLGGHPLAYVAGGWIPGAYWVAERDALQAVASLFFGTVVSVSFWYIAVRLPAGEAADAAPGGEIGPDN